MKTYDVPEVLAAMRNIVRLKPNMIIDACAYYKLSKDVTDIAKEITDIDQEHPLCLIGHVFSMLNVDVVTLVLNNTPVTGIPGIEKHFTPDAVAVMRAAQLVQDDHYCWEEALKAAENYAKDLEVFNDEILV